jgi:hypothetical protein
MTGPYIAKVFLNTHPARTHGITPDLTLTWEDDRGILERGTVISYKFYRSGGGATLEGTLRAAAFAMGDMLEAGESAYIRLHGRNVTMKDDDAFAGDVKVRRAVNGLFLSTLGSKLGRERAFRGV